MRQPSSSPICPLCHTLDFVVTEAFVAAGGGWQCTTCGQRWDAGRLATVAAYARFVSDRALRREGTERGRFFLSPVVHVNGDKG